MSPHHFSKQMNNPYFRTKYFQEESKTAQIEKKIENKLNKIKNALNPIYWVKKVKVRREKKNPI
jgi:hypothetical protein